MVAKQKNTELIVLDKTSSSYDHESFFLFHSFLLLFFPPLAPSFILKVFRLIAEIYKVISPCLDIPDSIYLVNLCLLSVMSNVLPLLENEAQKK